MKSRYIMATSLSVAGLADAAYLSYERLQPGTLVCPVTGNGCSAVEQSWFAAPFGLPIAYVGFVGYALMVILALMASTGRNLGSFKAEVVLRWVVLAAVITAIVLFGIQAFVIEAFCFWCLVSALIDCALFAVVYTSEQPASRAPVGKGRQRGRITHKRQAAWPVVTASLLAIPVLIAFATAAGTSAAPTGSVGAVNAAYPTKGDENAPVTVVVYSDYQCPACAAYATEFEPQFDAVYVATGKVRVEFRDYPLRQHANAVKAAMAARIAGTYGKYWQMHDLLFEQQAEWQGIRNPDDLFTGYAKALGIDANGFRTALQRGDFRDAVTASAAQAYAANIPGTPTIQVNGADVSSWSDILPAVDEALAAHASTR